MGQFTHCPVWDSPSTVPFWGSTTSVDLSHLAHLVRSSYVRHEKAPAGAWAEFRCGARLVEGHVPHEHSYCTSSTWDSSIMKNSPKHRMSNCAWGSGFHPPLTFHRQAGADHQSSPSPSTLSSFVAGPGPAVGVVEHRVPSPPGERSRHFVQRLTCEFIPLGTPVLPIQRRRWSV